MKKTTLFLLFCLNFGTSQAQISILAPDMARAGDTMRVMNAAIAGLANRIQASGPDFIWDFSDLQPQTDELINHQSALNTPYFFLALSATYGIKVVDEIDLLVTAFRNIYDFYNVSNNRLAIVGRGVTVEGFPIPVIYTDPDEVFFFPLTYGRKDSSTFSYTLNIPTLGAFASRGGRLTEVDGWGTVRTPEGNYTCLRVKSTLRIVDSISFQGINLPLPLRTEVEYYWLAKNERVPVLKIRGNSLFGTFQPTLVQYRYVPSPPIPPISVPVPAGQMVVYPNPSSDFLFIALNQLDKMEGVQLFDEMGRRVFEHAGSLKAGIDLRGFESGVYSLRVYGQYGVYTSRVVVVKP
ncbi:MAG: T9SS type A sorting domain-containing protein [Bacteroidia bacterium]